MSPGWPDPQLKALTNEATAWFLIMHFSLSLSLSLLAIVTHTHTKGTFLCENVNMMVTCQFIVVLWPFAKSTIHLEFSFRFSSCDIFGEESLLCMLYLFKGGTWNNNCLIFCWSENFLGCTS